MTRKQELKRLIAYNEREFLTFKLQAEYWTAMATTGAAKMRDMRKWVELTPQQQLTISDQNRQDVKTGHIELQKTDDEKTKDALDTVQRHINIMRDFSEAIYDMQKELSDLGGH